MKDFNFWLFVYHIIWIKILTMMLSDLGLCYTPDSPTPRRDLMLWTFIVTILCCICFNDLLNLL